MVTSPCCSAAWLGLRSTTPGDQLAGAPHRMHICRYGQTGAGKTYTMTGGQQSFQQRGIIPRVVHKVRPCC